MLLFVYCLLIVLASLLGGWLPGLVQMTHKRMQVMMSFVGGFMLGVAMLHLIPHAIAETGAVDKIATSAIVGLLVTFFMIRWFHVHQHGHEVGDGHEHHEDVCEHDDHEHHHTHRLSWSGLFFGLAMHTFLDGIALGASVTATARSPDSATAVVGIAGIGTFLAVLLHKPLDALSITCVMLGCDWSRRSVNFVNLAFASMCPLGAVVFYFGVAQVATDQTLIVGMALGFAAGIFLCISLADILPELQFHQHDRWLLTVALLAGVLLAWGVGFIEPQHAHSQVPASETSAHEHHAH